MLWRRFAGSRATAKNAKSAASKNISTGIASSWNLIALLDGPDGQNVMDACGCNKVIERSKMVSGMVFELID
jgi:hypothetical protein